MFRFCTKRFMGMPEGFQCLSVAKVGQPAPNFSVKAWDPIQGKIVDKMGLSAFQGKKVLLFFYPLDFTFVCPTEIICFSDRAEEFAKLNCQVVGCSIDSVFVHKAWCETPRKKGGIEALKIPLLADVTKDISRDYGVLVEEDGIALRGTFLLDEKHVIQHSSINNLALGRSVDEALRMVQALDESQKGNVVPCGWTPGKKSMNVAKAGEFFESQN